MSATVLLAVVFVLSLTLVTWLLNQLPQRMIGGFDASHRYRCLLITFLKIISFKRRGAGSHPILIFLPTWVVCRYRYFF